MKVKKKEDRQLLTRDATQKSLSEVQAEITGEYSSGKLGLSKYMRYMQMVTFSFKPLTTKR